MHDPLPIRPPLTTTGVSAYENEHHIIIAANRCYRGPMGFDMSIVPILLPRNCSNDQLGASISSGLTMSRIVSIEELKSFSADVDRHQKFENWMGEFITAIGYKSQKAYYKKMMLCRIELEDGTITIFPTVHERLKAWGVEKGDELAPIVLSVGYTTTQLGEALRHGFGRCFARRSF